MPRRFGRGIGGSVRDRTGVHFALTDSIVYGHRRF